MLTAEDARRLALGLPESTEQDHHGRPSFRVGGRIFATLWTPCAMNIMAAEEVILAAVEDLPHACSEFRWGKRLGAVQVDLSAARAADLEALLFASWSLRAPRRLLGDS